MTTKEILKELEHCEVNSLTFEGCVGVFNGKLYRAGEVIEYSDEQVQELWNEYIEEELGDISGLL